MSSDIKIEYTPDRGAVETIASEVSDFCKNSRVVFEDRFRPSSDGAILVIKYIPPTRLSSVLRDQMIYASGEKGYTWGDAVYVSPLTSPFSTMMYGSAGVVGTIKPSVVFDGTNPIGVRLYQLWLRLQFRYYDLLTTTMHSDYVARILRNKFRTDFGIDCVFFRPDQFAPNYVRRHLDHWFAVSNWTGTGAYRRVTKGPSSVVEGIELCVVVSEEFGKRSDFLFTPWLGGELRARGSEPIAIQPRDMTLGLALRVRYLGIRANRLNRLPLEKIYVTHETP